MWLEELLYCQNIGCWSCLKSSSSLRRSSRWTRISASLQTVHTAERQTCLDAIKEKAVWLLCSSASRWSVSTPVSWGASGFFYANLQSHWALQKIVAFKFLKCMFSKSDNRRKYSVIKVLDRKLYCDSSWSWFSTPTRPHPAAPYWSPGRSRLSMTRLSLMLSSLTWVSRWSIFSSREAGPAPAPPRRQYAPTGPVMKYTAMMKHSGSTARSGSPSNLCRM